MYSALKRDGRPLYELARRGVTVDREARSINIEALQVVQAGERDLEIDVVCSKGTYIRVLAEELAAGLGTLGHLSSLRRLWVEPFTGAPMVTLEQIEATDIAGEGVTAPEWLQPVDRAFPDLPALRLDAPGSLFLRQGRVLTAPAELAAAPHVRVYDEQGSFLGLVEVTADRQVRVQRLFVAGAGTPI
jgi:tRNA pseudouridine55 synthase